MKKLFICALALLLIGTGCGNGEAVSPSTAQPVKKDIWTFPDLHLCTEETEKGLYQIESLRQGSCNILYVDYESAQMLPLCNVPNCEHNNESCTSYIALNEDQVPPMILTNGEKIFIINHGASSTQNAKIQVAEMSGENRHTLFEAAPGEGLGAALYADQQAIYFEKLSTEEIDGELKQVDTLMQINMDTEKAQPITRLVEHVFYGDFDDGFLVGQYDEQENGTINVGYYKLNIPKDGSDPWMDSSPVYQTDSSTGAYIMNNRICAYNYDTNVFSETKTDSGETRQMDCSALIPDYERGKGHEPAISELAGDYYRLTVYHKDENGNFPTTYYVIDLKNGIISEPFTLQIESVGGVNVALVGEYKDEFCVVYDYLDKVITYNGPSGLETAELSIPQYAMMKKSDYFSSIPNYKPVQDLGVTW